MDLSTYAPGRGVAKPRQPYERQGNLPNGLSVPVEFDFEPDVERYSAGHVQNRRGLNRSRRAHVAGAALFAGAIRPVYSVGTLGMALHTEPDEDLGQYASVYGARVVEGRVVWSMTEWHARCLIGLAWCVRPVTATLAMEPQTVGSNG